MCSYFTVTPRVLSSLVVVVCQVVYWAGQAGAYHPVGRLAPMSVVLSIDWNLTPRAPLGVLIVSILPCRADAPVEYCLDFAYRVG